MKAQIQERSKQEIAEAAVRIKGELREAIILVEDPEEQVPPPVPGEDILDEMEPYTAKVGNAELLP